MRRLIAAMNMTLDGVCDHTVMSADDEIHEHYTDLLLATDTALYGRVTYQLMEYWRSVAEHPTGNKATDDFATAIGDISKIVYSRTLPNVEWKNTELKREIVKDEILDLKRQPGKSILVGSPSLIISLGKLGMIDEYQIAIHPSVAGSGMQLFKNVGDRIDLTLSRTKTFGCGAVVMYYEPDV
jgi:dihydrofolate reductase